MIEHFRERKSGLTIEYQGYSHISPRLSNISAPETVSRIVHNHCFRALETYSKAYYANTCPPVTGWQGMYMKYKSPVMLSVERVRISCDISRISLPTDHDLDLNCKVLIGRVSFFAPRLVRFLHLEQIGIWILLGTSALALSLHVVGVVWTCVVGDKKKVHALSVFVEPAQIR